MLWCGWGREGSPDARGYDDHCRYLVDDLGAGGLVFFARNVGDPEAVASLVARVADRAETMPLLGVDQEGGRVCRMDWPGCVFSGNMALGALDDPSRTRAIARALAEQLSALGIGVNFAPVLDVNNNPRNPVIGVRSYGGDPELVARHGVAALQGFREGGVLPVIKHFPGHGDTVGDSHYVMPEQHADRARLDAVELYPFRQALESGYETAVMSTHILFPALDPEYPSTLSRRILTDLLRKELGYRGLVVTDCMEMGAIAERWTPEEAAVLAVEAGADMLVISHSRDVQVRMHRALVEAVGAGRLSEDRLAESVARADAARSLCPANGRPGALGTVGAAGYQELEARTALEALVLLPGRSFAGFDREGPLLVAGAPAMRERLCQNLERHGIAARPAPRGETGESELGRAAQVLWAVTTAEPYPNGVIPAAAAEALASHPRALVVGLQEPYGLEAYAGTAPRLALWGAGRPHLEALCRWLLLPRVGG